MKFIRGRYNITSDPIWLAWFISSSLPKTKGKLSVLDVGIGTGGASLATLVHTPDAKITGIDISESMLAECAKNAELNGRETELIHGDIMTWRTGRTFDIVITNPPYFRGTPRAGTGVHHNADLTKWTRACLRRVKPRGYFYCIIDATVLTDIIAALHAGRAGDIEILPLFGVADRPAERVLVRARLGTRGGTKIHAGMSMNDDDVLRNKN